MFTRSYLLFALISLLILGACHMPGAGTMDHGSMEGTEPMEDGGTMAEDAMTDDAMDAGEMMTDTHTMSDTMMADETMADEMMAGEMMTDTHAMTDTMMPDDGMTGEMDESGMMTDTHTMSDTTASSMEMGDAMSDGMLDLPAWQTMPLTDARTGATFTLADYAGKTVFVETMATWCTNCRQQLGNVKSAAARADSGEVVFIAISVETDLAAETLAQYADNNDFGWTFAVATPAMVRALADTFGPTIANPPATPHFWIHPDGTHGDLVTGFESGDAILDQLAG
ncbi:MAG: TlpA family protein disulfide reductase [Caldilineaceae bacterium]|nr:TlpA family protein disulfide reductase [Caldilineaceae bacterium]